MPIDVNLPTDLGTLSDTPTFPSWRRRADDSLVEHRGCLEWAQILISRQANDSDGIRAFTNRLGFAVPPSNLKDRPHPQFLAWHRDNCFKQ
ncbi:hypothetical protein [Telmatospirillum sp.]|uniref:hypothetical protein n=1 Tax=Telmatospirillum sp. TaxID=2079197 RepID=UPI00283BB74B|nr:hypothetical protein [Telmatospirillum sp.]MDR3439038.1 hypothetical protein [Telmatospirillum sp.]